MEHLEHLMVKMVSCCAHDFSPPSARLLSSPLQGRKKQATRRMFFVLSTRMRPSLTFVVMS